VSKIINFPLRAPTPIAAPYAPDPRNGEVYATESHLCHYVNGEELEVWDGFVVVHMSRSGDSASIDRGFASLEAAEAHAIREATRRNAVYLPPQRGGRN